MNEILLIFGMTAVTFGIRYPVLALVGRVQLPDWILRALRYVPPAVLTALIIPAMLMPDGVNLSLTVRNAYLAGGMAAFLIAAWRKNLLWTILGGIQ